MRPLLLHAVISLILLTPACGKGETARTVATPILSIQIDGVRHDRRDVVRWGPDAERYVSWDHHTNRLVPVYTFGTRGAAPGVDLDAYRGANSVYRDADRLTRLYGRLPVETVNPRAEYLDQTDLFRIQEHGAESGKRYIFLVIFDGMDWQTTRAAAIFRAGRVPDGARGGGLHFLDYDAGGTTQFGFMVTAPADNRRRGQVDKQRVLEDDDGLYGGYDAARGGAVPWEQGADPDYIRGIGAEARAAHPFADSASTATSMCSGIKTYNGAINVDPEGHPQLPIARRLQERGYGVGVVTSVPVSHATPAAAYANNVSRADYQDLSRDLLGLPSIAHRERPLPGVDVLIGCGAGIERTADAEQGRNFVPGNRYLAEEDLRSVSARYVVVRRTEGRKGARELADAVSEAASTGRGLLGFYGTGEANLPFRTADGGYDPVVRGSPERYPAADVIENPTLAEMTAAAIEVLASRSTGFWMMVEAGDVDWANHETNIDNSIGAVISGDEAVRVITDWVEKYSNWNESLLIVTADHGHYLVLVDPQGLTGAR